MSVPARPSSHEIAAYNDDLRNRSPLEITQWAIRHAGGNAIVSTNFRPYEAVTLHLAVQVAPHMPVLWVDHGYNRPATYRHAEALRRRLKLNLQAFVPRMTAAHRDAVHGPIPSLDDEEQLEKFSATMKLEPFERGMRSLAPRVWITGLRRVQNANRAAMDHIAWDEKFQTLKVSPVLLLEDADMEAYLQAHDLPNEWDYSDPAKADEKRECGLHVPAVAAAGKIGARG